MQDLLGEVHDLDVLWATALSCHVFPDEASRKSWHAQHCGRADEADRGVPARTRSGRIRCGTSWRAGLPQGKQIQAIATLRMKLWAKALDPDFAHSERVARLALELYDGLTRWLLGSAMRCSRMARRDARASLQIAALLHDVGKARGNKGHHKASFELIRSHSNPLGWKAGIPAARGHRRTLSRGSAYPRAATRHCAICCLTSRRSRFSWRRSCRLANAFDAAHDGHIRRVKIENADAIGKRKREPMDSCASPRSWRRTRRWSSGRRFCGWQSDCAGHRR